ncbi:MAG: glycosyltransferase [Ectothiorhodospiraceae bacterium]|nr:glycosyltransferase [Ectothiorhodospiraceae bacterium]
MTAGGREEGGAEQAARTPRPRVSVIVPTRNRREMTTELVLALWEQTLPHDQYEIIVLDNRSTDGTAERMRELAARSPCAMTFHVMPENRGPARSRNTGAQMARADILAFTDSDCMPVANWLELGLPAFDAPDVAIASGSILYRPGSTITFFTRATGEVRGQAHPTFSWTNTFYRRSVFLEMGGSDESLCYSQFGNAAVDCGDTDLAWRILEAGHRSAFVSDATVYTQLENLPPQKWLLELSRMFVVPALIRRHPQLRAKILHHRVFLYPWSEPFLLAVLGAVLALAWHPVGLALALPWLHWTVTAGGGKVSIARLPRIAARIVLLTTRQAITVAIMLYGSLRFRALVL